MRFLYRPTIGTVPRRGSPQAVPIFANAKLGVKGSFQVL